MFFFFTRYWVNDDVEAVESVGELVTVNAGAEAAKEVADVVRATVDAVEESCVGVRANDEDETQGENGLNPGVVDRLFVSGWMVEKATDDGVHRARHHDAKREVDSDHINAVPDLRIPREANII